MSGVVPDIVSDDSPAVRREQLRSYLLTAPTASLGGLVLGGAMILAFWRFGNHGAIVAWTSLLLLVLGARLAIAVAYRARRATVRDQGLGTWLNAFRAAILLHGVLWGALPWLLFPEADIEHQFLLCFIVGIAGVGSITVATFDPLPALAYLVLTLGPLIARLMAMEGDVPPLVGGLIFLFLVFLRLNAWRTDGTTRDNLRLRAAEAEKTRALRRSEKLLERVAEMVGVGGWELDATARKLTWTDQTYRIHELSPGSELALEAGISYYAKHVQPAVREAVDVALTRGEPFDFEAPLVTATGRSIWVRAIGRPESEDGSVVLLSGAIQDITERRDKEAVVRQQAAFFEALNQTTLDLLSRQSVDGVLRAIVERATGLLDAPFGELSLLDEDALVIRATTHHHPYPIGARLSRDEAPLSWRVLDERVSVIVPDYAGMPHAPNAYDALGLKAVAEFPIVRDDRLLGVLSLGRTVAGRVFDSSQMKHGEMFAQMAALVLHNAGVHADAVRAAEERSVAVRESEERFRRLFQESPTTIVVASIPDGRILDVNEFAAQMFGYTSAEVLGRTTEELNLWLDGEDRKRYLEILERDGRVSGFETTLRKKNGEPVNVLFFTALLGQSAEGKATTLSTILDITPRKQAEYAIQKFRAALDQSVDAVYLVDPYTGKFIDLNQTAHERLGYTRDEHLQLTLTDIEPADKDHVPWRDHLGALRRAGHLTYEDRHVRKDGQTFPVELNVRYIAGPPQDYMIAIVRDITERKRTERAMLENEERFHAVFDHSPVIIALLSVPEGRIVEANEASVRAFGYSREETIGRTSVDLRLWARDEDRTSYLQRLRAEGTVSGYEVEMRRKDGSTFPALYYGRLIHIGGQVFSLNTVQDITLRKDAERRLQELNLALEDKVHERTEEVEAARRLAEQANQAKSQFLANMSHEIRTPLNGVLGMLEALRQTSLRAHQAQMADLAHESATSLLAIIEDILDFSKIEAGMVDIESAPLSIATVVEKVCELLDHVAAKSDVELTLFTDPALPDQLLGDAMRVRQVLHNIVGNAIKFTGSQTELRRVRVNARRIEDRGDMVMVALEVIDTGIGMDEKALARVFDSFTQADASITRRFGGTGLGLNISRNLAQLMGGEIHVSSSPGKGSTFTVYLPFRKTTLAPSGLFEVARLAGLRCALVGQETGFMGDLTTYLSDAGAEVEFVTGTIEIGPLVSRALSAPHVVVVDAAEVGLTLAQARAEGARRPAVRFLILSRGRRRRARRSRANVVEIDTNVLTRRTFLRAVALAADPGRGELTETPASRTRLPNSTAPTSRGGAPETAILVAEDNRVNQMVILQQLRSLGYAADVVSDGSTALTAWSSGSYALLITDLQMPGMDGYELSAAIRQQELVKGREPAPIIALTANAFDDEMHRCRAAGMNDFLGKPAGITEMRALLEKWLPKVKRVVPPGG